MLKLTRSVMRGEGGAALVVTLLVAVVGVVALGATATLAHGTLRSASQWRDAGAVRYVAESGINEALYRLKFNALGVSHRVYPSDPPSFSSNSGLVGDGARYDVWVWEDVSNPVVKHIVAVGVQGSTRQLVQARARPLQEAGPFVGDNPVVGPGAYLPFVPPPANLDPVYSLRLTSPKTYYLGYPPPGSLGKGEEYITPHRLQQVGDRMVAIYYVNLLTIDSRANVVICNDPANPVPVHIWVAGLPDYQPDVYFAGQSDINKGGDPTRLVIWVPGEASININLEGQSEFVGCIYAPLSHMYIAGQAAMVGGVRVATLDCQGQATFQEIEDIPWPDGAYLDYRVVVYE